MSFPVLFPFYHNYSIQNDPILKLRNTSVYYSIWQKHLLKVPEYLVLVRSSNFQYYCYY